MRIALVYRSFNLSGSQPRRTVELARQLSRRHDVHVFSIGQRTDITLAPECTFHDVTVSHLGDGFRFSARELLTFAARAARQVAGERFDIVHACNPSTWLGDVLHLPGVARGEAALQGSSLARFVASNLRHSGNAARWIVERRALGNRALRRIHVDAPSVVVDLERYHGIPPDCVLIVPPAVNLDEFGPAQDRGAARASVSMKDLHRSLLLFCGNDFERKGLDRAIEMLAATEIDAELLVAGEFAGEGRFRAMAQAHGVGDRVHFLGRRDDVARYFKAADILLLPTRADVWGATPIEAMASGVPSIVTSVVGSAPAVCKAAAGIVLSEPFDARDFREAVERLARDDTLRRTMGRNGLAAVGAHSWERRAQLVEDDLVDVVQGRFGPHGTRDR
jgi:glycosyltransferase involved in cell wall biosynthesis